MKYFFLAFTLTFWNSSFSQSDGFTTALNNSKKNGRPLVVIQQDRQMMDYYRGKELSADLILDSIISQPGNSAILNRDYNIYLQNIQSITEAEKYIFDKFIPDYTPNILVFTPDLELISFHEPLETTYEQGVGLRYHIADFPSALRDTILLKTSQFNWRMQKEAEADSNKIDLENLRELILMRYSARLKSRELLNKYARERGAIDSKVAHIIHENGLKPNDEMVDYFLKSENPDDGDWVILKQYLINSMIEMAFYSKDKEEFILATELEDRYSNELAAKLSQQMSGELLTIKESALKESLREDQLQKRFEFYVSIGDEENIRIYGEKFADFLLDEYKKRKTNYLGNERDMLAFLSPAQVFDSVTNSYKKQVYDTEEILKRRSKEYDKNTSQLLNQIVWYHYMYVSDKHSLKKALSWSIEMINFERKSAQLDTHAHLLYKLGKVKKAIKYEEEAIAEARKENRTGYIEEFSSELERFKKRL